MDIKEKEFGILSNGKKIKLYTLNAGDLKFSLTNYGAAWTSLIVPSKNGDMDDILLGFSGLDGYLNNGPFFGVTIGRFANRIKDSRFTLGGKTYNLYANDGLNNLHSGPRGFDKMLWRSEAYEENQGAYIRFELESPDGDNGFPGRLKAVVSYGLTKANEIIADYQARVDQACPINFTNHAYFNLAGEGKGDILSHEVVIHSSAYVEADKKFIPTGRLVPVDGGFGSAGKAFNFKARKEIKTDFDALDNGYDHCFVVDGTPGELRPCAEVYENNSGRSMKVFTTQPGVQFYTGNFLNDVPGKQGSRYMKHSGFCLETQHFPDSPNRSEFPSCIAKPGNDYHEKAIFSFGF
ncbi:MAG: galactose mutarotase [Treponema sp.]|jgi:aldose 1-epimerase|nr:galactose mutarotase [Treponema sp.]